MDYQQVHILGEEDFVLMLGLLGIEGTVIKSGDIFLEKFEELTKRPSIGMIIIAIPLSNEIINFLMDFKLNNRKPFVFVLPDIFQPNVEKEDIIINKIFQVIGDIV